LALLGEGTKLRGVPIIEVREGSVTDADVDVLVNASNTMLRLGSGVSNAIRMACGPGYQAFLDGELARHGGGLEPGAVVMTHAGTHPRARCVAHVAVMDYREDAGGPAPDRARIERGTIALWEQIEQVDLPLVSVGMVALGAGTGNLGVRGPTTIACETLKAHVASRSSKLARVVFHGYSMVEYLNVLDVVALAFRLDLGAVDPSVRAYIEQLRKSGV